MDLGVARCNVDTGIRDNTTNEIDYDLWNKKIQQSQMEISIINLLIDYINGKDIDIFVLVSWWGYKNLDDLFRNNETMNYNSNEIL